MDHSADQLIFGFIIFRGGGCAGSSFILHGLSLVAASWGVLFTEVSRLLTAAASLVVEHSL